MAKRKRERDLWESILSVSGVDVQVARKWRVIRGYFEIHELERGEDIAAGPLEAVHESHVLKMDRDDCLKRVSSSFYSFPLHDKERRKLIEIVLNLKSSFGDTVARQIVFANLKQFLFQFKGKVGLESRAFLRVLNMCHDALENVKSEQLKKNQVDALKFVIENLKEDIDDFMATELEGILLDAGLEPTPVVEGIAEFYE